MPGSYFTASDIAGRLEEQNRTSEGYKTWRQMYGAIDLAKQQEMSNLRYGTEQNIADAYAEAYAAKQAVANTNYFDAYKETLDLGIDKALTEAYDTYIKNYESGMYTIESQAKSAREQITDALQGEAENYAALANKPYEYLQYLYDTYYSDETARANMLEKGVDWESYPFARFLKDEVDQAGNTTGNKVLKTWDELVAGDESTTALFDVDPETGEKTLNAAGLDYYDMMLNNPYYDSGMTTFDEWLAGNDEDLYGWYTSYNPYTVAAKSEYDQNTYGGSAFRDFIGLKSTDQQYSMLERFGGMSKEVLDKQLGGLSDKITALSDIEIKSGNSKEVLEKSKDLLSEFRSVTKKLGIEKELDAELEAAGISWERIEEGFANSLNSYENPAGTFFKELGISTGTGAGVGGVIGGITGAAIGSAALGIVGIPGGVAGGLIGAAIGAIAGLLTGVVTGSIGTVQAKKRNKQRADISRKVAINSVYGLESYLYAMYEKGQNNK